VKFRYLDGVLATYQEIRDRIYQLARQRDLRLDWREFNRDTRTLLLYDSRQVVVARATVPVRHLGPRVLTTLSRELTGVFGEGWMN
jgi:hypothetical protein